MGLHSNGRFLGVFVNIRHLYHRLIFAGKGISYSGGNYLGTQLLLQAAGSVCHYQTLPLKSMGAKVKPTQVQW
jgi:hypothetical protein